jgi:hypothetical protein
LLLLSAEFDAQVFVVDEVDDDDDDDPSQL